MECLWKVQRRNELYKPIIMICYDHNEPEPVYCKECGVEIHHEYEYCSDRCLLKNVDMIDWEFDGLSIYDGHAVMTTYGSDGQQYYGWVKYENGKILSEPKDITR